MGAIFLGPSRFDSTGKARLEQKQKQSKTLARSGKLKLAATEKMSKYRVRNKINFLEKDHRKNRNETQGMVDNQESPLKKVFSRDLY